MNEELLKEMFGEYNAEIFKDKENQEGIVLKNEKGEEIKIENEKINYISGEYCPTKYPEKGNKEELIEYILLVLQKAYTISYEEGLALSTQDYILPLLRNKRNFQEEKEKEKLIEDFQEQLRITFHHYEVSKNKLKEKKEEKKPKQKSFLNKIGF